MVSEKREFNELWNVLGAGTISPGQSGIIEREKRWLLAEPTAQASLGGENRHLLLENK